ncbi:MAG: hypothetical protein R2779_10210 [Crocinitomicaceae bacterium]
MICNHIECNDENFQKRNVSIIEFLTLKSFNNAQSEVARIKIQLATSAEQLNLLTGKDVFNDK